MVGRCGHLIDAVPEEEANNEEEAAPYVVRYEAEDIITWHEEVVRGRKRLVMVVLQEVRTFPSTDVDDDLEIKSKVQFRVLLLRQSAQEFKGEDAQLLRASDFENGSVYVQQVWELREGEGDKKKKLVQISSVVPRRKGGRALDYIPFRFLNWNGESPSPSKPPMIDLANVNLSHYRNSADLEHGRHYTALPTPVAVGFKLDGDTLEIGSRTAWVSEDPGASAMMLEFTGKGLGHLQEGMTKKEGQMAVLGARLLEEQKGGSEKPEAIKLRQTGDRSVLTNIVDSVGDSWTWLLNRMWDWARVDPLTEPLRVSLNTDFTSSSLPPQMLTALTAALHTSSISWQTFVEQLQRGEIIDSKITAEEEAERIAVGLPSGALASPSLDTPFPGAPGAKE